MSLFDAVASAQPAAVQQAKPQRGKFIKEGYFDWDNPKHATPSPQGTHIKEAIGCLLPPYANYLQERVQAAVAGQPFSIPFYLMVALHMLGHRNDKAKVFCHCQRDLIRANKIGTGYPMLAPEVAQQPDLCPICESCWDNVWTKVKQYENAKESNEYKAYKEAHRQLCPQSKYLFNFLPGGSLDPLLLEAPKTLGESICNIHYDNRQPDLLWPYTVGSFTCCWVLIRRIDMPDTTKYEVTPIYPGTPHVRNAAGAFDEAQYLSVIAKIKDLREVSKTYLADAEEMAKALIKRDQILTFHGLAVAGAVSAAVAQATAGVPGSIAAATPAIPAPPTFATPAPAAVPVIPAPTATLPAPALPASPPMAVASAPAPVVAAPPPAAGPPMPAPAAAAPAAAAPVVPTLPATPPPPAVAPPPAGPPPSASQAFDVLQQLLGQPPK